MGAHDDDGCLECALAEIPGVLHVQIDTAPSGRPVRIAATTDLSQTKQDFVRHIQAVAMSVTHRDVDFRIITITQIQPATDDEGRSAPVDLLPHRHRPVGRPARGGGGGSGRPPTAIALAAEDDDGRRGVAAITTADGRLVELHAVRRPQQSMADFLQLLVSVALPLLPEDDEQTPLTLVRRPLVGRLGPLRQTAGSQATEPESPLRLESIKVTTAEGTTTALVALSLVDSTFTGHAVAASDQTRARLIAEATVAALTELLGIPAQIESSQVIEVGVRDVAITTLTLEIPRLGEQVLCGSALVRGDAEDAVARSVLAAVNRRLSG